jgi:hypothetical protein
MEAAGPRDVRYTHDALRDDRLPIRVAAKSARQVVLQSVATTYGSATPVIAIHCPKGSSLHLRHRNGSGAS